MSGAKPAGGTAEAGEGSVQPRRVRVGLISLGCAKNLVDTEVMLGHLDRVGCQFVTDPRDAEVIVVNTCGFIEPAREESIQTILEAARLKQEGRLERLVVAGCMVQRYRDELQRELPEVDAFVDLDRLDRIVEAAGISGGPAAEPRRTGDLPVLQSVTATKSDAVPAAPPTAVAAWNSATYLYDDTTPRRLATPPWSAYIKIAEGCDHTCAFCAIPSFRGSFRSRQPDSIVREAELLVRQGVRELNLIAQDSSHYGRDLGINEGLAALLAELNRIDAVRWIRVHYLYPNTVSEPLIATMAACSRVVPYVDLPLQHADARTLKRMRRGGSAATHLRLLERFRAVIPDVSVRSTFIVGFPGETEEEFATLLDFAREAAFDHLGVFIYSHEDRTPAADRADDVAPELKEERRARLMECQQAIVARLAAARIGGRAEVLVEGSHPETEHLLVGRTAGQALDVDGQVLINDGFAPPGSFATVEMTEIAGYDLVGRIVDGPWRDSDMIAEG